MQCEIVIQLLNRYGKQKKVKRHNSKCVSCTFNTLTVGQNLWSIRQSVHKATCAANATHTLTTRATSWATCTCVAVGTPDRKVSGARGTWESNLHIDVQRTLSFILTVCACVPMHDKVNCITPQNHMWVIVHAILSGYVVSYQHTTTHKLPTYVECVRLLLVVFRKTS